MERINNHLLWLSFNFVEHKTRIDFRFSSGGEGMYPQFNNLSARRDCRKFIKHACFTQKERVSISRRNTGGEGPLKANDTVIIFFDFHL